MDRSLSDGRILSMKKRVRGYGRNLYRRKEPGLWSSIHLGKAAHGFHNPGGKETGIRLLSFRGNMVEIIKGTGPGL
jgi:hypothetical protein